MQSNGRRSSVTILTIDSPTPAKDRTNVSPRRLIPEDGQQIFIRRSRRRSVISNDAAATAGRVYRRGSVISRQAAVTVRGDLQSSLKISQSKYSRRASITPYNQPDSGSESENDQQSDSSSPFMQARKILLQAARALSAKQSAIRNQIIAWDVLSIWKRIADASKELKGTVRFLVNCRYCPSELLRLQKLGKTDADLVKEKAACRFCRSPLVVAGAQHIMDLAYAISGAGVDKLPVHNTRNALQEQFEEQKTLHMQRLHEHQHNVKVEAEQALGNLEAKLKKGLEMVEENNRRMEEHEYEQEKKRVAMERQRMIQEFKMHLRGLLESGRKFNVELMMDHMRQAFKEDPLLHAESYKRRAEALKIIELQGRGMSAPQRLTDIKPPTSGQPQPREIKGITKTTKQHIIAGFKAFKSLSEDAIKASAKSSTLMSYPCGSKITDLAKSPNLHALFQGEADVYVDGNWSIRFGPGKIFGSLGNENDSPDTASETVICGSATAKCVVMPKELIKYLLEGKPQALADINKMASVDPDYYIQENDIDYSAIGLDRVSNRSFSIQESLSTHDFGDIAAEDSLAVMREDAPDTNTENLSTQDVEFMDDSATRTITREDESAVHEIEEDEWEVHESEAEVVRVKSECQSVEIISSLVENLRSSPDSTAADQETANHTLPPPTDEAVDATRAIGGQIGDPSDNLNFPNSPLYGQYIDRQQVMPKLLDFEQSNPSLGIVDNNRRSSTPLTQVLPTIAGENRPRPQSRQRMRVHSPPESRSVESSQQPQIEAPELAGDARPADRVEVRTRRNSPVSPALLIIQLLGPKSDNEDLSAEERQLGPRNKHQWKKARPGAAPSGPIDKYGIKYRSRQSMVTYHASSSPDLPFSAKGRHRSNTPNSLGRESRVHHSERIDTPETNLVEVVGSGTAHSGVHGNLISAYDSEVSDGRACLDGDHDAFPLSPAQIFIDTMKSDAQKALNDLEFPHSRPSSTSLSAEIASSQNADYDIRNYIAYASQEDTHDEEQVKRSQTPVSHRRKPRSRAAARKNRPKTAPIERVPSDASYTSGNPAQHEQTRPHTSLDKLYREAALDGRWDHLPIGRMRSRSALQMWRKMEAGKHPLEEIKRLGVSDETILRVQNRRSLSPPLRREEETNQ